MKPMNIRSTILLIILSSAPVAAGRDLSSYRTFSLGISVADLSRQIDRHPVDVVTVHERPALIQQVIWWPSSSPGSERRGEAIQQVRFCFYNDTLYKMVVSYDAASMRGLTPEDVEESLATQYGRPTGRSGEIKNEYGATETALARWEDSQYSFNLFRSSLSNRLGLVVFTKSLEAKAEAADTEAVAEELRDAPRKERARVKAEADDLSAIRYENLRTFLP